MIQRIQSLLLLIALILHILLYFMPLYKVQYVNEQKNPITVTLKIHQIEINKGESLKEQYSQVPLLQFIMNSILCLMIFSCIFLYKNRLRQNLFCRFLILLDAGVIATIVFEIDKIKNLFPGFAHNSVSQIPIAFPVVSLIMLFLASRAIMKDEDKVRSADRLR